MNYIKVNDLFFSYDGEYDVVNGISFSVEKGSYTTIIGQNGSGKSTIAKLLVGLIEPSKGTISIDGLELNESNIQEIRKRVGIVFQNPDNQFIGSTVADDIAFGLENQCLNPIDMQPIIERFAEEVKMTSYLDKEPTKLSGGQKQRVAIAGVLAMAPDILIFDESTSMLDPRGKTEINDLIKEIHREKELTIISITHDIEEAASSDHVIVLEQGKVVLDGHPKDVLIQKEELVRLQLDVPFAYKIVEELRANGLNVSDHISLEGLADEVWKLNSKK